MKKQIDFEFWINEVSTVFKESPTTYRRIYKDDLDNSYVFEYDKLTDVYFNRYNDMLIEYWGTNDTDFEVSEFIASFERWLDNHDRDIKHLIIGMFSDYNPLYNVDGTEIQTYGQTLQTTNYGERVNDTTHGNDVGTNKVKTTGGATKETDIINNEYGDISNTTHSAVDTVGDAEHTDTLRRYGNIGVTKSQELVTSEILLRRSYNLYDVVFAMYINDVGVPMVSEV